MQLIMIIPVYNLGGLYEMMLSFLLNAIISKKNIFVETFAYGRILINDWCRKLGKSNLEELFFHLVH